MVVGGLGDRRGDERAVAVVVVGVGFVGDEVIAAHELVGAEVGRAAKAPAVGVGDAGVEHRDDHAAPAWSTVGGDVGPGFGGVHGRSCFATKFHCSCSQSVGAPPSPGSLGMNAPVVWAR